MQWADRRTYRPTERPREKIRNARTFHNFQDYSEMLAQNRENIFTSTISSLRKYQPFALKHCFA